MLNEPNNAAAATAAPVPADEQPGAHEHEEDTFGDAAVDPEVLALLNDESDLDDFEYDEDEEEDDEPDEFAGAGLTAEAKVRMIVQAADAVKAEEIVALDVRELTIITDYFVICTGKSSIQIRAISDRIEDKLRNSGERKLRVEGRQEATWVLMDYGDVVVHVMAAEQRDFYRLEELWGEAARLELELLPA